MVHEIIFPDNITQITSLAFGGPKMNILYVTTANKDGDGPAGSGYLYKVTGLRAKGYPGVRLKVYKSCERKKCHKNDKKCKKCSNCTRNCYPFCRDDCIDNTNLCLSFRNATAALY